MHRMIRILIAVMVILLLVFVVGFLFPSAWYVERSVLIRAPAPAVFAYLNNLKNWRAWTAGHQQHPDLPIEYSGPVTGVGATSRWRDEHGRGVMKIVYTDINQRIDYKILLNGGVSSIDGVLKLLPDGEGTRVVWSATGATGRSPVARYYSQVLRYKLGTDYENSLQRLKQNLDPKT